MLDKIYTRLMDEKSKAIYKSRLFYSLTGDYDEIRRIVAGNGQAQELRQKISDVRDGQVLLWGTGFWGELDTEKFPGHQLGRIC